MVRAATLVLDQNDAAKALVVGRYMANGGSIDGVVTKLTRYQDGTVIATVKPRAGADRYIVVQGDLEAEVMSDEERQKLVQKGLIAP